MNAPRCTFPELVLRLGEMAADPRTSHRVILVAPKYYGLSDMEMTMKCIYGLPAPVRPIVYNE